MKNKNNKKVFQIIIFLQKIIHLTKNIKLRKEEQI